MERLNITNVNEGPSGPAEAGQGLVWLEILINSRPN